ncbi:hypothetical protein C4D60_Mb11t16800 [Musa balbisiana]|uniref:Uncharacterized protein n=1 Tax=Musa balbisiana TaxID=52838 RepID=A0A4S8J673_MUSBA|nr:hypothetical protein C4D60_Mb11t16800 [Musa balbisiana]
MGVWWWQWVCTTRNPKLIAPPQLSRIDNMIQGRIRGFMRGLGRRSALDIIDIDPQAYPPQTAKQT